MGNLIAKFGNEVILKLVQNSTGLKVPYWATSTLKNRITSFSIALSAVSQFVLIFNKI